MNGDRRSIAQDEADERDLLDELVTELDETRAVIASLQARELVLMASATALGERQIARTPSLSAQRREMPIRSIAAELATAARVNDRTMQRNMDDAARLCALFPATLDALGSYRITRAHAMTILETGSAIDDPAARAAFEQVVLSRAERETPGRLKAFARQLAERVQPTTMAERHATARLRRRVTVTELDDGMAEFVALLPAVEAFGIYDRITQQAKAIRKVTVREDDAGSSGDDADGEGADLRTMDEIRADLVTDMLLTGAPAIDPTVDALPGGLGAIRATIQVTVPVTTLAGTTDGGASIAGRAPIDPDTARRLAGAAPGWDRVMTHPVTGMVLAVDRYQPSAEQKRFLRVRDQHCRFPGCRTPARRCDVDHTHDAAKGGKTEVCNLACFCKRHHTLKHATDWTVVQKPGGILVWTSPTGRSYTDEPPPRVVFMPDGDPPSCLTAGLYP